jgi:hypothetical protein
MDNKKVWHGFLGNYRPRGDEEGENLQIARKRLRQRVNSNKLTAKLETELKEAKRSWPVDRLVYEKIKSYKQTPFGYKGLRIEVMNHTNFKRSDWPDWERDIRRWDPDPIHITEGSEYTPSIPMYDKLFAPEDTILHKGNILYLNKRLRGKIKVQLLSAAFKVIVGKRTLWFLYLNPKKDHKDTFKPMAPTKRDTAFIGDLNLKSNPTWMKLAADDVVEEFIAEVHLAIACISSFKITNCYALVPGWSTDHQVLYPDTSLEISLKPARVWSSIKIKKAIESCKEVESIAPLQTFFKEVKEDATLLVDFYKLNPVISSSHQLWKFYKKKLIGQIADLDEIPSTVYNEWASLYGHQEDWPPPINPRYKPPLPDDLMSHSQAHDRIGTEGDVRLKKIKSNARDVNGLKVNDLISLFNAAIESRTRALYDSIIKRCLEIVSWSSRAIVVNKKPVVRERGDTRLLCFMDACVRLYEMIISRDNIFVRLDHLTSAWCNGLYGWVKGRNTIELMKRLRPAQNSEGEEYKRQSDPLYAGT